MITQERIQKNFDFFMDNASKAAEARAHRHYLEGFTKHLLAKLAAESDAGTVSGREAEAVARKEYLDHLEGLKEAIKRDEWFRWQKDSRLAEIEAYRTQEANRRGMSNV